MLDKLKPTNFVIFELTAIAITALLKFIIMDRLGMRAFYITGTCLFWIWYVYYRYSNDHNVLRYWGFRKDNFVRSWTILLPFAIVSAILVFIYAGNNQVELMNPHIIPIFILYPLWGMVQQFIFLVIIALNMRQFRIFSKNRNRLYLVVSLLFSIIHFPYVPLMVYTFFMEIVFLIAYRKWRNMWAIGMAHGWSATLLLYYVLQRDLWQELFTWF
jgi:hypothetical protein